MGKCRCRWPAVKLYVTICGINMAQPTFVRQGLGILSWTRRGILLSMLGTLSNWRGEAKVVATKQEKIRNIIAVDALRLCRRLLDGGD